MKFEQGKDVILSPAQYNKLSLLFDVPVTDLLDEYNKFLYEGKGIHLKQYRKIHRLTQVHLQRNSGLSYKGLNDGNKVRMELIRNAGENFQRITNYYNYKTSNLSGISVI